MKSNHLDCQRVRARATRASHASITYTQTSQAPQQTAEMTTYVEMSL